MLLSQLKLQFIDHLKEQFAATEAESFFYILTEKHLGLRRIDLALKTGLEISAGSLQKFEIALERLKMEEPIQYITGETEFFGLNFQVTKNVLIPRPETEELVAWIISDCKDLNKNFEILDIGTGSGCIAISLANALPSAKVDAIDISEEALKIAKINAEANTTRINFQQKDILKIEKLEREYDVIVSNPPYVRDLEKAKMHKNVLEHEPSQALYVENEEALIFYEKISSLAQKSLKTKGVLYFEINQYLYKETKQLVESFGFKAYLKKDIFGNYRMLKALKS